MVVMASQMMHHTHDYEWNQEQQRRETKRQKHKWNGEMEGKWNEKTYDGG